MTFDLLERWKTNPAAVTEEEHENECYEGFVYLDDNTAARCPVCEWRRVREKAFKRMEQAGIARRYLETEWSDLEIKPPLDLIKKACDNITAVLDSGTSAIFTGQPGTGKSTAAALMAKAAIDAGRAAYMANIGRISTLVRAGYDGDGWTEAEAIRYLAEPDLLVLDDLGAGETREGSHETKLLYLALEERQANRKVTVVTTNLNVRDLEHRIGKRVMNRLMPFKVFTFHGPNWRMKQAADWGLE